MASAQETASTGGDVAAIVLAAGRSTRMGKFKPLLPFGNTSVIRTCIDQLRTAGMREIVVVLGHRAVEVREHLSDLNLEFAVNNDDSSEMNRSIACGVERLSSSSRAVLITLSDHPAVPSEDIRRLIDCWREGAKLVIPTFSERGGHPVLIDLQFRGELLTLTSGRSLKSVFEAHPDDVRRVAVSSPFIARDMDTWDDYRALHQDVFGVPPRDPLR